MNLFKGYEFILREVVSVSAPQWNQRWMESIHNKLKAKYCIKSLNTVYPGSNNYKQGEYHQQTTERTQSKELLMRKDATFFDTLQNRPFLLYLYKDSNSLAKITKVRHCKAINIFY
jgi:hypothetical protein